MTDESTPLFDLVCNSQNGAQHARLSWTGSFEEYFRLLERNPRPARNAWQRLLDMIESHGSETPTGKSYVTWNLFKDPLGCGRDAVEGLEKPLAELVNMIRAGARHLGPERRIMLLHGPVGSAKSTIARLLKRGLEVYTQTDEGALYTFSWNVDGEVIPSATHQDPLLLIPGAQRAEVAQRLSLSLGAEYELRIEGELDPVSRFWLKKLMDRYEGDWVKVMGHIQVQRLVFSEADRIGIGTFQPKDEKNQDSTELTGDLNYRKIAEYGSDSDPRAFNFDGEFCVANRGLLEFVEVLKLDVAFLYDLLGATQEHLIKPKKFAQTSIDEVILGHTNEPEYLRLLSNELMEAFRDRTIKIDIPYNLEVSAELAIHRSRYGQPGAPGRRLAPHTLEMASLWAVLTRLEEPALPNLTLLQKAHLYDGQEIQGFTREQVGELRAACEREGMEGISPRFVQDRIAACLVSEKPVVGPREILAAIEDGLQHNSMVANQELRRKYLERVAQVREEYQETIKHEVQVAIAADQEALDRLCSKYLDNVRAHTTREKVISGDGTSHAPDERLMRSIEDMIDVPEVRKDDFRHELMNYIAVVHLEGRTFDYRENRRLTRALELKLFEDHKDSIQLTSLVSNVVDPDTQQKIGLIRERLMRRFGYDEYSAEAVLHEVANLFAHDIDGSQEDEVEQAA
ncbi:MAG TPA: serine protein kinase [Planctomycetes bacterium]|nr:serine protein kinase [Planctomycetota bacterium]HIL37562.1 serine protein kinase [Planctomycetota bacterium]